MASLNSRLHASIEVSNKQPSTSLSSLPNLECHQSGRRLHPAGLPYPSNIFRNTYMGRETVKSPLFSVRIGWAESNGRSRDLPGSIANSSESFFLRRSHVPQCSTSGSFLLPFTECRSTRINKCTEEFSLHGVRHSLSSRNPNLSQVHRPLVPVLPTPFTKLYLCALPGKEATPIRIFSSSQDEDLELVEGLDSIPWQSSSNTSTKKDRNLIRDLIFWFTYHWSNVTGQTISGLKLLKRTNGL
ncbi:hypothetical protein C8R44DRAFT_187856 [Mycena epipterygia]|nr:hypothetical protein C8R44DRAFT_187856 [Mycena epipterygia]